MVGMSFSGSGRFVNEEWHIGREEARTNHFGIFEFGEIEIERLDLDTVEFNRAEKESTHITESKIEVEAGAHSGFDVRNLKDNLDDR